MSGSIEDAEWVVKVYYACSIYIAAGLLEGVDGTVRAAISWDFLWPLEWVSGFNTNLTLRTLGVACFIGSLVAFQLHRHMAARAVFRFSDGLFGFAATLLDLGLFPLRCNNNKDAA